MEKHHTIALTFQVRVTDFEKGKQWYEKLLNRPPDYIPHEDFAEWEIIPNAWIQVAKGETAIGCGPLRLGVRDIEEESKRLTKELGVSIEVMRREGVPAAWASFEDPFGNRIGIFQEL